MINIIFFISVCLMVILAFANNGSANDDHFTVMELISQFGVLPESEQCWQCYHPKLYHFLCAQIWKLFSLESQTWKYISAQLLNTVFGIGTFIILRRYALGMKFNEGVKVIAFALVAFNPHMVTLFSQATNDGVIIFFGTLGMYSVLKLFKKPTLKHSVLVIVALVFGAMSKLNFGVYFIGTTITFLVLAIVHKNYSFSLRKGYLGTLVAAVVLTFGAAFFFNGYYTNIKKYGKAFTYNTHLYELPHLYQDSIILPYGGINNILSGYFTFHYFDLIKNPRILVADGLPTIKHLTSHFSQIYGRTHYLYFENWPKEWRTTSPAMITVGRVVLAVAILPSLVLLLGLGSMFYIVFRDLRHKRWKTLGEDDSWVILLFVTGYLLFSVCFSLFGRVHVFMKDIYLLPGVLCMLPVLCVGHTLFFKMIKNKALIKGYNVFMVGFILLYLIPIVDVTIRLIHNRIEG